jgi:hypothetical protein
MDKNTILSNGEPLSLLLSNFNHWLNNNDLDFVFSSLVKLTNKERLSVFIALTEVYVPARKGTEFETNYLESFFSAILTGSDKFIEELKIGLP